MEDTAFEICRGGGIWYISSIEGRYYGCPGSAKTKLQDMVALSSRVKDLKYKASSQAKGWIVKLIALCSGKGRMDQIQ